MNQATLPHTKEKSSVPTKIWTQDNPASRIVTIRTKLPCLKQEKNLLSLRRFEPRTTQLVELSLYEPGYPAANKRNIFVPTKIWTQDHPASRIIIIWTMLPCLKKEKNILSLPRFEPRTTQVVELSLYELGYPAPNKKKFLSLPRFEPRTTQLVELSLYEPCYPASNKRKIFCPYQALKPGPPS